MTATAGYNGQILVTSSPSVSATNLSLADAGDHQTYNVSTSSSQRYWDQTQSGLFVVQTSPDGVTWTTKTNYTVSKYVNGQIFFTVANAAGTQVRMQTVYYFPFSTLGDCKEWQLTLDDQIADVTAFNSTGWKSELPLLGSASVKISKFWVDNTFMQDLGNLMVVVLYPVSTSPNRYEMYAYIKQDTVKDAVNAVIEEEVSFDVTGPVYFMTS